MSDEIDKLRQRITELEVIARDYTRVQQLVDYAAQGGDLTRSMSLSVLYVDPFTQQVIDANDAALELLGYPRSRLIGMTVDQLAISPSTPPVHSPEADYARLYTLTYQRPDGHDFLLTVDHWPIEREDRRVVYYRLTESSLHRRLWHELQRRETEGFHFQQKLTALNEVTVQLSRIEPLDPLCHQIVALGVSLLGFDRLGLWLNDPDHAVMRGTYGTDEQGSIRAEHDQVWHYTGSQIESYIAGTTTTPLVFTESPLYNHKCEIVRYGWNVIVPLLYGSRCLGVLSADNFTHGHPLQDYEPELLRLYGITAAHLIELARTREQAVTLRVAQGRTGMLREFITNVGHDFRTPLSVINTKAYLLQRVIDPGDRAALVNSINQQVKQLGDIVDRMLELVTLQSNPTLHRERLPVTALVNLVLSAQRNVIAAKGLHVDLHINPTLSVCADHDHAVRALHEILENAVQYTPHEGTIRIEGVAYPQEVGIRVRDSGTGMDAATLKRVFEPLYRGDQARTERNIGFGLAIAKAIAEAHGGRILAESTLGQGSTFEIVLPEDRTCPLP